MKIPTYAESEEAIDEGTATPVHKFIYHNEPGDSRDEIKFRKHLQQMVDFLTKGRRAGQDTAASQGADRT